MSLDVQSIHNDDHQSHYVYANFGKVAVHGLQFDATNVLTGKTIKVKPKGASEVPLQDLPSLSWAKSRGYVCRWLSPVTNYSPQNQGLYAYGMPALMGYYDPLEAEWRILKHGWANNALPDDTADYRAPFSKYVVYNGIKKLTNLYVLAACWWEQPVTGIEYLKVVGCTDVPGIGTVNLTYEMYAKSDMSVALSYTLSPVTGFPTQFCFSKDASKLVFKEGTAHSWREITFPGLFPPSAASVDLSALPGYVADEDYTDIDHAPYTLTGFNTLTARTVDEGFTCPAAGLTCELVGLGYDDATSALSPLWKITSLAGTWQDIQRSGTTVVLTGPPTNYNEHHYTFSRFSNYTRTTQVKLGATVIASGTATTDFSENLAWDEVQPNEAYYHHDSSGSVSLANAWRILDFDLSRGAVVLALCPEYVNTASGGGDGPQYTYTTSWSSSRDAIDLSAWVYYKGNLQAVGVPVSFAATPVSPHQGADAASGFFAQQPPYYITAAYTGRADWYFGGLVSINRVLSYETLIGGTDLGPLAMPYPYGIFGRLAYDYARKVAVASVVSYAYSEDVPHGGNNNVPAYGGTFTLDEAGVMTNVTAQSGLLGGISTVYKGDLLE